MTAKLWDFSLICSGIDDWTDEVVETVCLKAHDAAFAKSNGVLYADLERESTSAADAIAGALEDLEAAWPGLLVSHVEPDDLVTMADIAERIDCSREAVRLWVNGQRGGGHFPLPSHNALGRSRLWRWLDVVEWMRSADVDATVTDDVVELAAAIDDANRELRSRVSNHLAVHGW